jgi:hypothetical protein
MPQRKHFQKSQEHVYVRTGGRGGRARYRLVAQEIPNPQEPPNIASTSHEGLQNSPPVVSPPGDADSGPSYDGFQESQYEEIPRQRKSGKVGFC